MLTTPIGRLRLLGMIEGVSFLLLLFVAMPLKYAAGMPEAVKAVGWVHGLLFIGFCGALLQVMMVTEWPMKRGAAVFIAALLPFGPFVIDRRIREWEAGGSPAGESAR